MRRLRFFLLLICIGRIGQVGCAIGFGDVFAHLGKGFGSDAGRIGSHVSNEADQSLVAKLDAFIQTLRNHHGALYAEAELARGILLQLAGRKRRSGIAPALFLFRGPYSPIGIFKSEPDFFRVLAVGDFNFLFALPEKACVERGRLRGRQIGVDRPIFFFLEGLDLAFAIHDQTQRNRLHASSGKSPANFVPQ